MQAWFFSFLALVGAQREGSAARRAAFIGWMSAPVYLLFTLWTVAGWHLAGGDPTLNGQVLGYAAVYGALMTLAWSAAALYGLHLDRARAPDRFYAAAMLWLYAGTSSLSCYLVGTHTLITGLVMMGGPLIGLMLFPMRQIALVFGAGVLAILACSVASAMGAIPYAPVLDSALFGRASPSLYYALSGVIGAGLYVAYEVVIMMALVSAWHYREAGVRELSRTDTLTGVANRRHIIEELEKLLAGQARQGDRVAVVMVDIDHFKQINDRYGHLAGDRALTAAAQALRGCLRNSDLIGRYGGEEFLIVLPGATREAATEVAERCRQAVSLSRVEAGGTPLRLTASLGVASRDAGEVRDADALIHLADEAMYAAKQAGRNRVMAD